MPGDDVAPTIATTTTPQQYAEAYLRWYNVKEHKSDIVLDGKLQWSNGKAIQTGSNIQFINKGKIFSGKWIIRTARFELNQGHLTTTVILRKCLPPGDYPLLTGADISGD